MKKIFTIAVLLITIFIAYSSAQTTNSNDEIVVVDVVPAIVMPMEVAPVHYDGLISWTMTFLFFAVIISALYIWRRTMNKSKRLQRQLNRNLKEQYKLKEKELLIRLAIDMEKAGPKEYAIMQISKAIGAIAQ